MRFSSGSFPQEEGRAAERQEEARWRRGLGAGTPRPPALQGARSSRAEGARLPSGRSVFLSCLLLFIHKPDGYRHGSLGLKEQREQRKSYKRREGALGC